MKNPIVVLGSSANRGATWDAVNLIIEKRSIPVINLAEYNISFYDYNYENQDDDYISIMERIILHDLIILATPVYWYCMSAQMKVFIDRLTDCITIRKDIGRALQNKRVGVIASSGGNNEGFETPLCLTCQYMKMKYEGCYFYYSGKNDLLRADNQKNANFFRNKWF